MYCWTNNLMLAIYFLERKFNNMADSKEPKIYKAEPVQINSKLVIIKF